MLPQLTTALGEHAFAELDARHIYSDAVTAQLAQEMENGRLLRLLAKLSMVTERADMDTHWAETGARPTPRPPVQNITYSCRRNGGRLEPERRRESGEEKVASVSS